MSSPTLGDRCAETSTTTGTGTYDLDGAITKYQTIVAGCGDGATVHYYAVDQVGSDWEVGEGVVTDATPDTLTRATIFASSNGGAAVDWAAGTRNIVVTLTDDAFDRLLNEDDIGTAVQAYDADIPTVAASQAEMEAGTEAALRSMSPLRVAQAIETIGGASGKLLQFDYAETATNFTPTTSYTAANSVSFEITVGSKVIILVGGAINQLTDRYVIGKITRDTTDISVEEVVINPAGVSGNPTFFLMGVDSPGGSGPYVYKLNTKRAAGAEGTQITSSIILVFEIGA